MSLAASVFVIAFLGLIVAPIVATVLMCLGALVGGASFLLWMVLIIAGVVVKDALNYARHRPSQFGLFVFLGAVAAAGILGLR